MSKKKNSLPKVDPVPDELERQFTSVKLRFLKFLEDEKLTPRDCNERQGLKVQIIAETVCETVQLSAYPGSIVSTAEIIARHK